MNLEKICNLYSSDFHFCTTLMSFIEKNSQNDKQVINIFETDLKKDIEELTNEELLDLYKTVKDFVTYLNNELKDDENGS